MLVWNAQDAEKMFLWLQKQEIIFYDIETNGLNCRKDSIIGIGVSNAFTGFYVPTFTFNSTSGQLEPVPGANQIATRLLEALKGKKVCAFNGAFDLPFTKNFFGIDLLPNYHCDVLLLKHTVDEEFPFKLKEIAVQVFGYGAASEQRDLLAELKALGAPKGEIYKARPETIGKYCIQDCVLTGRLYNHYSKLLKQQELVKFFYEDEVMPLYKHVTIPMEQYGIRLDLPLMQQALQEIKVDIEQIESSIHSQIEPMLGIFYKWFLQKDYPPSLAGNFAQFYAKLHNLELPTTETGIVSPRVIADYHLFWGFPSCKTCT